METGELKDCSYKPSKITRDKEIEKASKEFAYNISSIRPELNADSFKQGAKWVDKTIIEKACEWIKENIDTYAKVVIDPKSHYPEIVMCDTFEKNFKKAMGL